MVTLALILEAIAAHALASLLKDCEENLGAHIQPNNHGFM
jgi:hypothetical protein